MSLCLVVARTCFIRCMMYPEKAFDCVTDFYIWQYFQASRNIQTENATVTKQFGSGAYFEDPATKEKIISLFIE